MTKEEKKQLKGEIKNCFCTEDNLRRLMDDGKLEKVLLKLLDAISTDIGF